LCCGVNPQKPNVLDEFNWLNRNLAAMQNIILDEFSHLPISRQRKYQMRRQRDKRCTECGEPATRGSRCLKHLVKARERQRKKRGLKRRYYNTLSYKLQAGIL
jgi:hypothetical protein